MSYFRQLYDAASATYTYLICDGGCREAILVDPVLGEVPLYLSLLAERQLKLAYVLDTHIHSDHVTAAAVLRARTGARVAVGCNTGAQGADLLVDDGQTLALCDDTIRVIATPGHTPGCICYLWRDRLFTGDSLLIGACGRTDFQGGDAGRLYDSLIRKLLAFPDETLVYPGHDYHGRLVSCIAQERRGNPLLRGKTRDEFVAGMNGVPPAEPVFDAALIAANRRCGEFDGPQGAAFHRTRRADNTGPGVEAPSQQSRVVQSAVPLGAQPQRALLHS
ncbi:MAG: MBL fold metallo-hydrolase [Rhodocyclaceae bacterium]|jgi:sulfur dioxygenase